MAIDREMAEVGLARACRQYSERYLYEEHRVMRNKAEGDEHVRILSDRAGKLVCEHCERASVHNAGYIMRHCRKR